MATNRQHKTNRNVKKETSRNQVIIAYLQKVGLAKSYEPKPTLNAKMMGKNSK